METRLKGTLECFHPADGDCQNRRLSKITNSCSRCLMQATIQNLKVKLNNTLLMPRRLLLLPVCCPADSLDARRASTLLLRLFYKGRRAHVTSVTTSPVSLSVVYCISCRRCNYLYIRETGRWLREHFSEHLRSIRNQSHRFPVAEHFNSAFHSLDDVMVCGLKQCSNGLNINFNFL